MTTEITTYHLEMNSPEELRPSRDEGPRIETLRVEIPCPELNRFFYTTIGRDWNWTDRLPWTDEQWLEYLDRPAQETWVGYVSGTPIGYFELEAQPGKHVEIVYFGLLPRFAGRGFGGRLLTRTVELAWAMKPRRVWVHTCTLDHPAALANYRARGFRLFSEVVSSVEPGA